MRLRIYFGAAAFGIPICLLVIPFTIFAWKESIPEWAQLLLIPLVALGFTAALVLKGRDFLAQLGYIRRGLKAGKVDDYAGSIPEGINYVGPLFPLIADGFLTAGNSSAQKISVLTGSGLVMRANEKEIIRAGIKVATREIASNDVDPFTVTLDIRSLLASVNASGKLSRRHFSAEEREEMEGEIAAYGEILTFRRVVALFFLGLLVVSCVVQGAYVFFTKYSLPAMAVLTASYFEAQRMRAKLRHSSWLKRDLEENAILVLEENSLEGGNLRLEILAVSQSIWTMGGKPAGWRLDI